MTLPAAADRLGVLGGTFDPIHSGHLAAATAARDALKLTRVMIVPSHMPPHRSAAPFASQFHRFAMAALAVNGIPRLFVSDDELNAAGSSYTADTLDRLRDAGWSPLQIFFIIGADAFAEIATWHRYPQVVELANFAVIARPGYALEQLAQRVPQLAARMKAVDEGVRTADPSIFLLDAQTPDVSSTEIRTRRRQAASIRGLVPALVEAHIVQHNLYAGEPAVQLHAEN